MNARYGILSHIIWIKEKEMIDWLVRFLSYSLEMRMYGQNCSNAKLTDETVDAIMAFRPKIHEQSMIPFFLFSSIHFQYNIKLLFIIV